MTTTEGYLYKLRFSVAPLLSTNAANPDTLGTAVPEPELDVRPALEPFQISRKRKMIMSTVHDQGRGGSWGTREASLERA